MISVVVCSVNKPGRAAFAEQLQRTIGTVYELILVENDIKKLPIAAAYNQAAMTARYPYLCFVHEDVTFHTPGWGKDLVQRLEEKKEAGIIGLAGATLKTRNPSPWWITHEDPLATGYRRMHYIQSGAEQSVYGDHDTAFDEVICLDGFFLVCSKRTWEMTKFDQRILTGFHFYDLDICLAAHAKGLKNYVYKGCRIEHHSSGTLNEDWIESAESFHQKWRPQLPVAITAVPAGDWTRLEKLALVDYIHALIRLGYMRKALGYIARLLTKNKYGPGDGQVIKAYIRRLLHL
jgi:GT2 family glycosyltransferase